MELIEVPNQADLEKILMGVLKNLVSSEELEDIVSGLLLTLEDGSALYSLSHDGEDAGFIIVTPLSEDEEKLTKIDLISIDEIWIKPKFENRSTAEVIANAIKVISSRFKCKDVEIIVPQSVTWLAETLQENGFVCAEIKLEKVLPTPNNLGDVLELIRDSMPIDRIIQVLFEKDDELMAEIIEDIDEIDEFTNDGWIPTIVVVTFEPESMDINEIINQSNPLINWDDYNLIYRGEYD